MGIARENIVRSTAGRDKGQYLFVLREDGEYLLLADGKGRKVENPKRKKRKHTVFAAGGTAGTAERIRNEEPITNSELRRTLAIFGGEGNPDQEG